MDGYVRAKQRILRNQKASDWAVIGVDDAHGQRLLDRARARRPAAGRCRSRSAAAWRAGSTSSAGSCTTRSPRRTTRPAGRSPTSTRSRACAARTTGRTPPPPTPSRARSASPPATAAARPRAASRASPTAWRRSRLADGVRFVNDSKATNPEAAARALACFERIYWIAGGRPKQAGLDPLLPWLGPRAPRLSDRRGGGGLRAGAGSPRSPAPGAAISRPRSRRPRRRRGASRAAAVVLLAPACASFDQFTDFEARGDAFKALVAAQLGPPPAHRRRAGGRPMTPVQPHPARPARPLVVDGRPPAAGRASACSR